MTLRLAGSTSGYTQIDAPAVAGSNTLVLPTGNGSADQALVTNGSGTLSFADRGRMVQGTAQNSTSGTSIDFTGIPSWAKRVTVILNRVSTNGTSLIQVQLGTSAGVTTTGYLSAAWAGGSSNVGSTSTTGFVATYSTSASDNLVGHILVTNVSGNIYVASGVTGLNPTTTNVNNALSGSVTLSGTLDRIRITTVNGTDTFDAGSINILYEG
jgi:hypothetical protein